MSYYSSRCSQCISSLLVHRRNRCTLNTSYFTTYQFRSFSACRAFRSCSLFHGEAPFHSSLETSLDGRVIRGKPCCSMVYDADIVAKNAADRWINQSSHGVVSCVWIVREFARNLDIIITYPRKHLRLSMRGRRQGHPKNCFQHLEIRKQARHHK